MVIKANKWIVHRTNKSNKTIASSSTINVFTCPVTFFLKKGQPCVAVAVLTVLSSGSDWDGEISSPPINSAGS
jgi:hypothetical protein